MCIDNAVILPIHRIRQHEPAALICISGRGTGGACGQLENNSAIQETISRGIRNSGNEKSGIELVLCPHVYACTADVTCRHERVARKLPLEAERPRLDIRWMHVVAPHWNEL